MLAPWKRAMMNLDSVLKSRDLTLPTKVHLVKAMVFPVVMYGCDCQVSDEVREGAQGDSCGATEVRSPWTWRGLPESVSFPMSRLFT